MADNLTPKEEFLLNPVTEHNITDAAVASFETNFKHPLKVTVPITPIQDLHGMPNPYPAGASVNLIPDGTNTENGYVAGQYLVADGTMTANTNYYVSEYFQISENTVYTWSNRINTAIAPSICFYDENKIFISGININGQYSQTFTSPVGAVYCRSSQTKYTYQEANSVNATYQLEVGTTATAYRRYSNICPINGQNECKIIHIGLPDGYVAAEYVKLKSRVVINTNGIINWDSFSLGVGCDFRANAYKKYGAIFSSYIAETKNATRLIFNTGINNFIYNNNFTANTSRAISGFSAGEFNTVQIWYGVGYINGIRYDLSTGNIGNANTSEALVLGYYGCNIDYKRVYVLTSPETTETCLMALVPCSNSSGIAGFYDVINQRFYTTDDPTQIQAFGTMKNPQSRDRCFVPFGYIVKNNLRQTNISWEEEAGAVYGGSLTLNEDGSVDLVSRLVSYNIPSSRWAWRSTISDWYIKRSSLSPLPANNASSSSSFVGYCSVCNFGSYNDVNNNKVHNAVAFSSASDTNWLICNIGNSSTRPPDMQVVMKRATPVTYHFPNVGQLKAFLGQNNVWSDIANVDVKYLTQNSETGIEYRGDRALELRRRAMIADAPKIHTTVGSSETGGLASFRSYVKAPVKKIEIPFSPKQDFNGYDFPWPGGGYVQLFNSATTTYGSKIDVDGTLTEDANYFVSDFIPVTASTYYYVSSEMPVVVGYNSSKELLQVIKNSGTGGAFQTPENCAYVRIQNYTEESDASAQASAAETAYVCAGSEENQWYPYENICPISRWDGVNISHTEKNLVQLTTDMIVTAPWSSSTPAFKVYLPEGTYTGKFFGSNVYNYIYAYIYDKNGIPISTDNIKFSTGTNYWYPRTFTMPPNGGYLYIFRAIANNPVTYITNAMFCVVQGTTIPEEFIPYTGTTLSLTFDQTGDHTFPPIQEGTGNPSPENIRSIHPGLTFARDDDSVISVYGGTLTVNADGTGSLVEKNANAVCSSFSKISSYSGTPYVEYVAADAKSTGGNAWTDYKCSAFKPNARATWETFRIGGRFYFFIDSATTLEEMNAIASQIQVVYPLAEPVTYTLSVTETNRALEALGLTQHIGPLYGGTITINPDGSADVVATWIYGTPNYSKLGGNSWSNGGYRNSYNYMTGGALLNFPSSANHREIISDKAVRGSFEETSTNPIVMVTSPDYIYFGVKSELLESDNLAGLRAYLVEHAPVICYPLKQKDYITYHFSNLEQLKVWLGENNFWCDISDDITVKYLNRG